jgi:hypothetical protein
VAASRFAQTGDRLEQRAFSAPGRADDGGKMPIRKMRADLRQKGHCLATWVHLQRELFEFEHERGGL